MTTLAPGETDLSSIIYLMRIIDAGGPASHEQLMAAEPSRSSCAGAHNHPRPQPPVVAPRSRAAGDATHQSGILMVIRDFTEFARKQSACAL
jgi:hypothetical protein